MSGYYGNPPPGTGYNGGPPPPPPGQGRPDGTYPVYQIDFTVMRKHRHRPCTYTTPTQRTYTRTRGVFVEIL